MDEHALAMRVDELEKGHKRLADAISANTALTEQVHNNTAELLELFSATKTGIKLAGRLAGAIKFTAAFVAACAAAYVAIKNVFGGS